MSVVLKELDGYYDFGGGVGIPLDVPSPSDEYSLRFTADWKPKGTQTIKSIDINILNFNEGNTLADIKIQHLSDPKLSAYFKNFYLCHYTPSGSKERDEYVSSL